MSTHIAQNNWSDTKMKIKARWNRFDDSQVDGFKDNLDKVAAQIQKTYGTTKEQAEKEFKEFQASLQPEKSGDQPRLAVASAQSDAKVSEGGSRR